MMYLTPLSRTQVSFLVALSLVVLSLLFSSTALAEQGWSFKAGSRIFQDSNLFKESSGREIEEEIITKSLGLGYQKEFSQQSFRLQLGINQNSYRDNSYLDHNGKTADVDWDWRVGSRLKGVFSGSFDESIKGFADDSGTARNLRTTHNYRFEMNWRMFHRYWLVGAGSKYRRENETVDLAESDYESRSAEFGVKYLVPEGSYLSLVGRLSDGDFDNREPDAFRGQDSGFEQHVVELRFLWLAGGKSRLSGFLGYLQREHDHFDSRDYDGMIGKLFHRWDVSGFFSLQSTISQNYVSYQTSLESDIYNISRSRGYFNSSYYQLRSIDLSPTWQVSKKLVLVGVLAREQRNYDGGLTPGLGKRDDIYHTGSLALYWSPRNLLTLSVDWVRDERKSNRDFADFESDRISLGVSLKI
ncbi:MAG: hypothetical protein MI976_30590 [Pseudomonadales bacterium]|nr:hypothetical protein [Pseudomonadales bacterium]